LKLIVRTRRVIRIKYISNFIGRLTKEPAKFPSPVEERHGEALPGNALVGFVIR
jgi:hypothetical protein